MPQLAHIWNALLLKFATFSAYRLTQLPGAVFELPHLQVLDLSGNMLRDIPEDVIKLKSLKILDVRNNPIAGVPKNVARHFYGATEIIWDGSK